jgi:endonuclease/exonuclease/phosphatase family metal-dependent hydrolase
MPIAHLFAASALVLPLQTPPRIVIDGRFEDWSGVVARLNDPTDAPDAAVDFGEVRVAHDERFIHLLIDFGRVVNVQRLEGTASLLLDADGDKRTGQSVSGMPGVDAVVEMTPADPGSRGRQGRGAGLRLTGAAGLRSPYEIGLATGPTYSSRWFELRLQRRVELPGTAPFLAGDRFAGRLEFTDLDGRVRDTTDIFLHELSPVDPAPGGQPTDPLESPSPADLRVVTWNVDFGSLLRDQRRFGRVLQAIDPDIILLQELTEQTTPRQLVEFLERRLPAEDRGPWRALVGAGGGDLRTAVAARLPLEPVPTLHIVPYPDEPDRTVRLSAAAVGNGRRLLVVSVHLRCCGYAGSFEDRTRHMEAGATRRAVRRALDAGEFDGVIVAGDLNLVGSRWPLDLVAEGLGGGGSALALAEARRIDGLSNATWSDPDQPFVPGRLDYLLYGDTALESINDFAMDTRDLLPRWLDAHGLQPDDTVSASDHLPIVADLRWVDEQP